MTYWILFMLTVFNPALPTPDLLFSSGASITVSRDSCCFLTVSSVKYFSSFGTLVCSVPLLHDGFLTRQGFSAHWLGL